MELEYSPHKVKEKDAALILFVAENIRGCRSKGLKKIAKILFKIDVFAFMTLGRRITSFEYRKLEHGPVPESFYPDIDRLQLDQLLIKKSKSHGSFTEYQLEPLVQADLSLFSAEELEAMNSILKETRSKTGKQLEDETHCNTLWEKLAVGQRIDPSDWIHFESRLPNADIPALRERFAKYLVD